MGQGNPWARWVHRRLYPLEPDLANVRMVGRCLEIWDPVLWNIFAVTNDPTKYLGDAY